MNEEQKQKEEPEYGKLLWQMREQTQYLRMCKSYLRILTWGLVIIPWIIAIVSVVIVGSR